MEDKAAFDSVDAWQMRAAPMKKRAVMLGGMSKAKSAAPGHSARAGVVRGMSTFAPGSLLQVPVKVEMVQSGREFKFERLLVLEQQLTLSVEARAACGWRCGCG